MVDNLDGFARAAEPAASIAPFLARTHIAYFSMEIALRPEMPPGRHVG